MAKKDLSNYQKQIIADYYKNLDDITLNRLQELVTDLYLAQSPKKIDLLWQRAKNHMLKLKIPQKIIEHIMGKKDVQILAKNLQDWLKNAPKK